MTDMTADFAPDQPLGVGKILGESFSIFFRKILTIFLIAFVPSALVFLLSRVLQGWDVFIGANFPDFSDPGYVTSYIASLLIGLV